MSTWDCAVLGAGSAGATAAWLLASKGVRTLLVDSRERRRVGAAWINGVEARLWADLDMGEPPAGVVHHAPHRFTLASSDGSVRCGVNDPPGVEVDMRALQAWLIELAEGAGATLRFGDPATFGPWNGSSRTVRIGNESHAVAAVIDATGFAGSPLQDRLVAALDVCNAWQGVHAVTDAGRCREWLEREGVAAGEIYSRAGVEGGYSILNVSVSEDVSRAAILTGAMHRRRYRDGASIARDFRESVDWIGRKLFGGGRLIPLAPITGNFVDDGLILLGDRAGHVFPTHGSGVACGMRAAAVAANSIAAAVQIGDTQAAHLWDFNVQWHRGRGATCAWYQPLRYASMSLHPAETATLIRSGLLNERTLRAGLAVTSPRMRAGDLLRALESLPDLLPLLPRFALAHALGERLGNHARQFPSRGPRGEFATWQAQQDSLMEQAQALALSGHPDGSLPS